MAQNLQTELLNLSNVPVYLEALPTNKNGHHKSFNGTGFITQWKGDYYLITNRHVVTDKDFYSGKPHKLQGPYVKLRVWGMCGTKLKLISTLDIIENSAPTYFNNSYNGNNTDLVAFKVDKSEFHCIAHIVVDKFRNYVDTILNMNSIVYITGYPGLSENKAINFILIGKTISPPQKDLSFKGGPQLPIIKINRPGPGGLSGSPVYKYVKEEGGLVFVGVYSASNSEYGVFWRPDVVLDLLKSIK